MKQKKSEAYKILKDKIITCEYPPGTFLNEAMLFSDLNLTRTPLRDALSRLEQEGLVQILPKKGIMVTDIAMSEIDKLFEVRILIETYCLQRYGNFMAQDVLLNFRRQFEREWDPDNISERAVAGTLHELYNVDISFHKYIISCLDNIYIKKMMEFVYIQDERVRYFTKPKVDPQTYLSLMEIIKIVDAILDHKIEEAIMNLKLHLEMSKSSTILAWTNMSPSGD